MPDLDFAGLAQQSRAAFKPDYPDVERRARRRRNTFRTAAGALLAAGLATAVVVINGLAGGPSAGPAGPPTPAPTYTQHGGGALPRPSFVRITPDGWDVAQPDKPLTGMFTELRAGDLDHLYIEYQDCRTSRCVAMLAASGDRGRTWRKFPLPYPPAGGSVAAVSGTTVIAVVGGIVEPQREYSVSVDGGATWRTTARREVDALPPGWPIMPIDPHDLIAYDPETGAIAAISSKDRRPSLSGYTMYGIPRQAGIWRIRYEFELPTPGTTGIPTMKREFWLEVSHDGGGTWQRRTLPEGLVVGTTNTGVRVRFRNLATLDGTTLVAVEELDNVIRLRVSRDGGHTWREGATIVPDGPLMSILPTHEGPILIETGGSVYRSTDAGITIERVGPSIGARAYAIPGGYAEPTNNSNYGIWLSPDGGTWTYIGPPPLP